jgi:hypothetical protein
MGQLNDWYKRCFRRVLVDMHIPDWNAEFLSRLDPAEYARTILSGGITSTMLYCNSHVGLAMYPSKAGPVHAGLSGRDFVGDVVRACHARGVAVVAYYSVVYNNALFLREPSWRIRPAEGDDVYERSRYGHCCPNSPYRDFAVAQTEEFCRLYPFDGVFFDMLFWPHVCLCDWCRERFRQEAGLEIPAVVDWHDPAWMAFQRARERWMGEFAGLLTAAVRRARPSMTVTHQMSPVLHPWTLGMPYSLAEHCDYCSGDFYGPAIQQSLVCKIYEAISTAKPFEFHTSQCVHLWDHVTMKSTTRLETQASLAPAHGSAFMFIDAIDPVGTLNQGVYRRIGEIFSRLAPYEPHLGGDLRADVAIYVSSESRFDFRENGVPLAGKDRKADNMALASSMPHMNAVQGAAKALQEAHIPYAVVTRANLNRLADYRVIMLPDVLVMDDAEIAAMRQFVARGGGLYASGRSSLTDIDGRPRADFGLTDVLGVSWRGDGERGLSFVTPTDPALLAAAEPQDHLMHQRGQVRVAAAGAEVLATVTLPWYPQAGGTVLRPSFASIHSTPPGPTGSDPAVTLACHGKGQAVYAAGALEAEDQPVSRWLVAALIRRLLGGPPTVEADAPSFVEVTVFEKDAGRRWNISLVALRDQDDCVPCQATVRVQVPPGRQPVVVRALPSGAAHPFTMTAGTLTFVVSSLEILKMFQIEWAQAVRSCTER